MYHGVSREDLRVWTQVTEKNFRAQMAYLERHYQPLPLSRLVKGLQSSETTSYTVSVTFDDGFENNISVAYPILQQHNIPSIFFITTGFINHLPPYGGFCWPDYVFALLKGCRKSILDLTDQGLQKYPLDSHKQIDRANDHICEKLKRISNTDKQRIIEIIKERTGNVINPVDRESFAPMSWSQINFLHKINLGTIGAHTVNHPILNQIDPTEVESEIIQSKLLLEQELSTSIEYFAYPNGQSKDFNNEIKTVVSRHFTGALSSIEGFNNSATDLFALRRMGIGNDIPLWKFKLLLSGVTVFVKRFIK